MKKNNKNGHTFLDVFSGAGGLSEGFIRAGFKPIGHVEADGSACYTMKTRMVYHWLTEQDRQDEYIDYLKGEKTRSDLYDLVPESEIASVINLKIGKESLSDIFSRIDQLLHGRSLDLIAGGPPCQAYSLVGRSRSGEAMLTDKRNYLYEYYVEFLKRYEPEYFVFESVQGLLTAKNENGALYFDKMRKLFREAGYETEYKLLWANHYGVAQHRKRIILVGKKGRTTGFYPEPETWEPGVKIGEIIRDLPSLKAGKGSILPCELKDYDGEYLYQAGIRNDDIPVTWHQARPHTERDLKIYRIAVQKWNQKEERLDYNDLPEDLKTHNNRSSFTDRFKVVASNLKSCQTIVAHISKDGHYYIHPYIRQNRSLTPREAARLQTFPDDYFFESVSEPPGRTPVFHQIGNAVPVLLAQKIADKLLEIW